MRTLKKTLALVLVVAMMMSLCITSNAAFTDADEIEYTEAVEVLTAIGVIDGFPSGDFQPQGSLTRAQAAKILVYILGEENYAKADGQIFDDVAPTHWAADYIAYCAENGLVDGYGNGKFGPEDKLTGYQWAKMLLGAMGVDTSYMIGAAWQIPVAKEAAAYGLFSGNMAADKTAIATREEACLYALNALNYYDEVTVGYAVYDEDDAIVEVYPTVSDAAHAAAALKLATGENYYITGKALDVALASMLYDIHGVALSRARDDWGRPGNLYTSRTIYSFYVDAPVAVYTEETAECDIAADLGLKKDAAITAMFVNGDLDTSNAEIEVADIASKTIGEQGRLTEIYANAKGFDVVKVDQYLAVVTDVTEAEWDRNGHLDDYAWLTIEVYAENKAMETVYLAAYAWDFVVGDMLLVYFDDADAADEYNYAELIAYADSMDGAQTAFTNKDSHIVEKVEYMDAYQFNHNEAGWDTAEYTWYFDTYGNLIGSFEIATIYNYGVISAIKWVEMDENMEDGYALATITYIDGTSANLKVSKIEGFGTGKGGTLCSEDVAETKQDNLGMVRKALYRIENTKAGLVLTETTALVNASVANGVPAIGTGVNAGDATAFLVYNGVSEQYETYTGIETVPSYKSIDDAWYVDLNGDKVAEYVFLNSPVGVDSEKTTAYYYDGKLVVTTVLGANKSVDHYVITGGAVNTEAAEIKTKSAAVVDAILANEATLMVLDYVNDYVVSATPVTTAPTLIYVNGAPVYVVYAGAVADATAGQNVLMTADASYNVRTAVVESYNGKTLSYNLKNDLGYLYIYYTQNAAGVKSALNIYISDVAGTEYVAPATLLEKLAVEVTADTVAAVEAAIVEAEAVIAKGEISIADAAKLQAAITAAKAAVADYKAAVALDDAQKNAMDLIAEETAAGGDWAAWTPGMIAAAENHVKTSTTAPTRDSIIAAAREVRLAQEDAVKSLTWDKGDYSAANNKLIEAKAAAVTTNINAASTLAAIDAAKKAFTDYVATVDTYAEEQVADAIASISAYENVSWTSSQNPTDIASTIKEPGVTATATVKSTVADGWYLTLTITSTLDSFVSDTMVLFVANYAAE